MSWQNTNSRTRNHKMLQHNRTLTKMLQNDLAGQVTKCCSAKALDSLRRVAIGNDPLAAEVARSAERSIHCPWAAGKVHLSLHLQWFDEQGTRLSSHSFSYNKRGQSGTKVFKGYYIGFKIRSIKSQTSSPGQLRNFICFDIKFLLSKEGRQLCVAIDIANPISTANPVCRVRSD